MTEEELVRRAREGDEQAFMALVRCYQAAIFRLAMAFLRHREEAEDATQDIFVHAFRRLPTLQDVRSFPIWLRKLAVRICLRYRRRRTIEREFVEPLSDECESEILFQTNIDPEVELERAELRALVRQAIAELPESFQVVVVLYHMDGLSYDEIAQVLGVPIGTVRSRLARARTMLRGKLAPLFQRLEGESPDAPQFSSVRQKLNRYTGGRCSSSADFSVRQKHQSVKAGDD